MSCRFRPGVVVESEGALAYVSLRFGHKGERPPPVIAAHLIEDNPRMASGIITFDLWIANQDRHEGNLAYARGTQPLHVFDHGHALLGATAAGQGIAALQRLERQPTPSSCLTPAMRTSRHFSEWAERVLAIRDDVIDDLVAAMTQGTGQAALTPDEGRATADFLKKRRVRIAEFLRTIRPLMPNVTDWELP